MSNRGRKEKQVEAKYASPREYARQYMEKRREKQQRTRKVLAATSASFARKLGKPVSNQSMIYPRIDKLRENIESLVLTKEPPTNSPLFIRRICDVVEGHLAALVVEFPELYRPDNRVKGKGATLEACLSKAAKIQERDLNKCYALLKQFEVLIKSSARPWMERYDSRNADAVANNRMNALCRLRSILPTQYSAPNGRPVEQVKHVIAEQLGHIFLMHGLPIKQSSLNAASIALEISTAVRHALKFHRFDMSESLKSTRRRAIPR